MRFPLATLGGGGPRKPRPPKKEPYSRPGRPRPLLVRIYAAFLSDLGLFGRPARRRALAFFFRCLPVAVAVLVTVLLASGFFESRSLGWPQAAALTALITSLVGTLWARSFRRAEGRRATFGAEMEVGALFVLGAYAVVEVTGPGPTESPLQPLVYLVMAFGVAFLSRLAALGLVSFAIALELMVWRGRGGSGTELSAVALHAGFLFFFALLYRLVLSGRLAASHRAESAAISRRLREIEERARALRLLGPGGADAEDASFTAAAVVEVEAAVRGVLGVAETALRCRTCAVYLLSEDDSELRLLECRSASDRIARGPLPAGEGALGAAVKTKRPVRLCGELKTPSYVKGGEVPGALLAVPLLEPQGGHVRGVVVADRAETDPFSETDERVLCALAVEILRASAAERLMGDLRRARDEKENVFAAVERLNKLAKPIEVFDATLEIARGLGGSDFAAITMHEMEGDRKVHRVVRVSGTLGAGVPTLEGLFWPDDAGLVSAAVRLKSRLPLKEIDVGKTPVLDPQTRLKGLASVRVLPLIVSGEALGTLLIGSSHPNAYGAEVTRQAEIVAMQAAESILRARLFGETERLATTDGLTGLLNHRTFQARLDELIAQAHRYSKRAALLICDIDHFKSVNDTYGHPVGDVVLRGVARILSREARGTDLVARYGGEEFAILMPETDRAGAVIIAERIRERIAGQAFETEQGSLRVTLSLGVAGYPEDADKKANLLERADAYLYQAKRSGRNRTVAGSRRAGGERATA